jgi:hypothetical protein
VSAQAAMLIMTRVLRRASPRRAVIGTTFQGGRTPVPRVFDRTARERR